MKQTPRESDAAAGQAALSWAVNRGQAAELATQIAAEVRRHRRRRLQLLSAACLVGIFAVGARWFAPPQPASPPDATAKISRPEVRVLPDGSLAELNRGARLTVDFNASGSGQRRVVLERGEAYFEVAKNSARPFVVVAGGVMVRAVGTAFAVEIGPEAVDVVVTEGRVAVASAGTSTDSGADPLTLVGAGERVAVARAGKVAGSLPGVIAVSAAERSALLAWRAPRVELSGTPLSEVIAIFNRHGSAKLELADPALGSLLVSGFLRADNTPALLRLLESEFGVIAEVGGSAVRLRLREKIPAAL